MSVHDDAAAAYEEARRRIAAWSPGEPLDLSWIFALDRLPDEIAELHELRDLHISLTHVADLAPLRGLANLRSLACSFPPVADLGPLQGLANLQRLNCMGTRVADLAPLEGLANLQRLNCSGTRVDDLAPLAGLTGLRRLDFSNCGIERAPTALWERPSLVKVICWQSTLPDMPAEMLSSHPNENALPRIRAHLRDLGPAPERMRDAKVMVLGNGRVGKTQLCRRLFDEPFEEAADPTHGIVVWPLPFDATSDASPATLHVWDFGGQDVYHGTHALFMRARAIFLVAWTPAAEKAGEHEHDGVLFRNYLLPYWLSYVKTFGGTAAPLLVVQTQCDRGAADVVPLDEPAATLLREFETATTLHHSALTGKGHAALEEALADLYAQIDQPLIGPGRAQVKARLERMREEDRKRPPEEKQHRTLPRAEFERMCEEAGLISDPALFLRFLSDAGVVFHRPGLFEDAVILDHTWALEAIYAVLDRSATLPILRDAMGGRFTRSLLATLLWDRAGYSPDEQELFLSMMRACGICFVHRPAQPELGIEAEYVAPDLLPEAPQRGEWRDDLGEHRRVRRHALLPGALIRSVIAAVGERAGERARYWRTGVYLFERELGARAVVQQEMTDDRAGAIVIRTQDGRAEELLKRLDRIVERCEARLDLRPVEVEGEPPRERAEPKEEAPPLDVKAERPARELWYFSYAHEPNERAGRPVDDFCREAEHRGREIIRDVEKLRYGESIQDFMRHELATGDRVFVWLTDEYLRSPYCMVELHALWWRAGGDARRLQEQVRLVLDVSIRHETEKAAFTHFWREQKKAIDEEAPHVAQMEGAFAARRDAIHRFASQTWQILDFIGNHKFKVYGGFSNLKQNELGHG
jgi:internalin A